MESRKRTPEDRRYLLYRIGAHVAWWGAAALTFAITFARLTKDIAEPPSRFEQVSGIFIILAMGVAIALGSALSRMRLARTITSVFEAGMALGRYQDQHGKVSQK